MDTKLIGFTPRQQEILWTLYTFPDVTDKELATQLGVTRGTVTTHLHRMRDRLQVRSTMGLVVTLIKDGWFEQSPIGDAVRTLKTSQTKNRN